MNLGESCNTTIVSLVDRFYALSWFSINHLTSVKKIQITFSLLCHGNYDCWCISLIICGWLKFYLMYICFVDFFSISRLVKRVISDNLLHKDLNNQTFSHVVHKLLGVIMWLDFFKNRTYSFHMFANPCITFVFAYVSLFLDMSF